MESNKEKIEEILSNLTLEEKVGMCHGAGLFRTEGVKRLNIKPLKMSDGPMGVRNEFPDDSWVPVGNNDDFVTYLPCNTALAATWNTDLARKSGEVLGSEARGRGKDVILGPGINIVRSPLCGRNFEYMSEDPYLISKMVVPLVKGIQENNDVAACVKHFALNNQETERLNVEVKVDERAFKEIYLKGFEAAVRYGKARAIMPAYNKVFGYFCAHNKRLLQDILRNEWGFKGVTISDWGAVHDTKEAAEAGLDVEMSVTYNFDDYYFAKPLIKAVKNGEIKEEVVDEKVRRILTLMYDLKMFSEDRSRGEYNSFENRKKTLDIARESIVLLKNENNVLPLKDNIKTLAVIGKNADIIHSNGGGSAEIKALYEITPLEGIKMRLGGNTKVSYEEGYSSDLSKREELIDRAVKLAKESDAVVLVCGTTHKSDDLELKDNATNVVIKGEENKTRIDCEGCDRSDLELPYGQDELIKRVLEVNKNAVVVLTSGSAIDMTKWIDDSSSVVQTFYNGMEGGRALAETLFGDINPSGKLPFTIPKKLEDCPAHKIGQFPGNKFVNYTEGIFVGYRYFSSYNVKPLFSFGHGLSYTKFKYEDLDVSINENKDDLSVVVKLKISNVGNRNGAEIVQLYINDAKSSLVRPALELKGFEKVYLEKGQSKEVEIKLDKKAFAFYDDRQDKWIVEKGEFNILVGSSCSDIRLKKTINLNSEYSFK